MTELITPFQALELDLSEPERARTVCKDLVSNCRSQFGQLLPGFLAMSLDEQTGFLKQAGKKLSGLQKAADVFGVTRGEIRSAFEAVKALYEDVAQEARTSPNYEKSKQAAKALATLFATAHALAAAIVSKIKMNGPPANGTTGDTNFIVGPAAPSPH